MHETSEKSPQGKNNNQQFFNLQKIHITNFNMKYVQDILDWALIKEGGDERQRNIRSFNDQTHQECS